MAKVEIEEAELAQLTQDLQRLREESAQLCADVGRLLRIAPAYTAEERDVLAAWVETDGPMCRRDLASFAADFVGSDVERLTRARILLAKLGVLDRVLAR